MSARLPADIWLHCILARHLPEDKDKVALLCTSKSMLHLMHQVVFTPIFSRVVVTIHVHVYNRFSLHESYREHRVYVASLLALRGSSAYTVELEAARVEAENAFRGLTAIDLARRCTLARYQACLLVQQIPHAILARELAHPVQLA